MKLLISACIVNFDLNLSTFHIFGAFVDIEHSWLVIFIEHIVQVVSNKASFSDGSVAHKHDFNVYLVSIWNVSARPIHRIFTHTISVNNVIV